MLIRCRLKPSIMRLIFACLFFNTVIITIVFGVNIVKSETTLFVDSTGTNSPDCGSIHKPCNTISYALGRVTLSNSTSALINILPGLYLPDTAKIDCTVGHLKRVVIRGLGEGIKIGLSVDIVKCKVMFSNIHWTSNISKPMLLNSIISNITVTNSRISDIKFSILTSGSSIELRSCTITNSFGWQPLFPIISVSGVAGFETKIIIENSNFSHNHAPVLSVKDASFVSLQKSHFLSNSVNNEEVLVTLARVEGFVDEASFTMNTGGNLRFSEGSIMNITRSVFNDNDVLNSTLIDVGQGVSLNVSECQFIKSKSKSKGPVIRIRKDAHATNLMSCHFSCNQVNMDANVSPITNDASSSIVRCVNCSTDPHCPVSCGDGNHLKDSIICQSCPVGTYSPGSGYNITTFACKKCDPGYYSSKTGSSSCMPCKPGSFAAKSGSTACSPCKNDFMTSSEGQASCSQLTIGFTVLTVSVVILILFPLILLFVQYIQTTRKMIPHKQKHFRRLYETASPT